MTIEATLRASDIERLDADLLLAFVLRKDGAWLLAHRDEEVSAPDRKTFGELVLRRMATEPLAYILGYKEFYGRRFIVTPDVLIPRPSTEGLIECALNFLRLPIDQVREVDSGITVFSRKLREIKPEIICDIGTGSGCIAITLALEGVEQNVVGVDTSAQALEIAEKNAKSLGANVSFALADGASYIEGMNTPFLLVSNPPYIPAGTALPSDVSDFEPPEALFAGSAGTDVLRPLIEAATKNSSCTGYVVECKTDQVGLLPS